MASYEDFLSRVLIDVPGCAEVSALLAVKDACIEFCEKSLVLVRDHDPITVEEGLVDYDLEPNSGEVIVKVMRAWMEGTPIDPAFPDIVKDASIYNRLYSSFQAAPSIPTRYLQKDPRQISLWPLPDKRYPNGLTLRVAVKPSRSSTSIDDIVFEDYAEVIAAGALRRLLLSSSKPYTNPGLATVKADEFKAGLNVARQRSSHGHTRSNLSVRMRRI
jgi:hypothetical protein